MLLRFEFLICICHSRSFFNSWKYVLNWMRMKRKCSQIVSYFANIGAKNLLGTSPGRERRKIWGFRSPKSKVCTPHLVRSRIWICKWIHSSSRNPLNLQFKPFCSILGVELKTQTKIWKIDVFNIWFWIDNSTSPLPIPLPPLPKR